MRIVNMFKLFDISKKYAKIKFLSSTLRKFSRIYLYTRIYYFKSAFYVVADRYMEKLRRFSQFFAESYMYFEKALSECKKRRFVEIGIKNRKHF